MRNFRNWNIWKDVTDRDEQFEFINQAALSFMKEGAPVISVDCKKKELIGNYKNSGVEWHKKREAPNVKVYDFIDKDLGKAMPYGVYDMAKNQGWGKCGDKQRYGRVCSKFY